VKPMWHPGGITSPTPARPRALVCKLVNKDGIWSLLCTTTQLHPHKRFAFFDKGTGCSAKVVTYETSEWCDYVYMSRVNRHLDTDFELAWQTEVPISVMRAVGLNAYAGDWADSILRAASKKMEPEFVWA
jgi:hypothetical protein